MEVTINYNGQAVAVEVQIYPKNLNGGKADGSYHQL